MIQQHVFREAGLAVNVHLFRHIGATLLLLNGRDPDVVTALLGQVPGSNVRERYAEIATAMAARDLDKLIATRRSDNRKGR